MDAVIIAGGKGSRMESHIPKPLMLAKNKPIISWQINYLYNSGLFDRIILALGHKGELVRKYFSKKYKGKDIKCVIEKKLLGTAGALRNCISYARSDFILVFNCDDLTDINLKKLTKNKENTLCVAHPRLQFGRVKEKNGYAVFEEKPLLDDWVSCGWYVFDRKKIEKKLPKKGMLEYDVFPKIKLRMFKHSGFWKPLNTKKDINEFNEMKIPKVLGK